jgi:hypothetical protein
VKDAGGIDRQTADTGEHASQDLWAIAEWCQQQSAHGCGNARCPKGCAYEYENVPNPHVRAEFWLSFDYDENTGWAWEVEGCGWVDRGEDPLALIHQLAEYARTQSGRAACESCGAPSTTTSPDGFPYCASCNEAAVEGGYDRPDLTVVHSDKRSPVSGGDA